MTVQGIDASHHQGVIDWRAVAGDGITFAVVKATEGAGYVDDTLRRNVVGAHAAGLIVGAYHFARPGSSGTGDAELEARHFVAVTAGLELDFVALDLEDDKVPPGRPLGPWVRTWLDDVEAATRLVPWLYTYAPYWREHGSTDAGWRRHPLWLADYSAPAAQLAPWPGYTVWQFTNGVNGDVRRVAGVGRVDVNRFDGDLTAFRRLVGLEAAAIDPVPHDPGGSEPMIVYPTWGKAQPDGRLPMFAVVDVTDHACTVIANAGAPFAAGLDKVPAPTMRYGAYGLLSTLRIEGLGGRPLGIDEAAGGLIAVGCADGGSVVVAKKPA